MPANMELITDAYRYVAERSLAGIYIVQEGKFRYMNRNAAAYAGYRRKDLWEMNPLDLTHPEDREKTFAEIVGMLQQKKSLPHSFRILTAQKETRWILQTLTPIIFEGKTALLGNCMDITDRVQAEEALRASEETAQRLAQENAVLAEIGRVVSSTLKIEEVYEKFSAEAFKLIPFDRIVVCLREPGEETFTIAYVSGLEIPVWPMGRSVSLAASPVEQAVRSRASVLFQPHSDEEVEDRFPAFLPGFRTGMRSMLTLPLVSRDEAFGALVFHSAAPDAYNLETQSLAEKIALQISGAIASAQLYLKQQQAEKELRASEQRYRILVENTNDLICEIDEDGRYLYISPNRQEITGHAAEKGLGKIFLTDVHPEDLPKIVKAIQDGHELLAAHMEFRWKHKSGEWRWFDTKGRAYRAADGRLRGVTVSRDITERKRSEDAVLKSEETAQRLARESAVLAEIGRIISSSLKIDTVYEKFSQAARQLIPFDRIVVNLFNSGQKTQMLRYVAGVKIPGRDVGDVIPLAGATAEEVLRARRGLIYHAGSAEEGQARFPALTPAFQAGIRSMLSAPLIAGDEVIGLLNISSLQGNAFRAEDLRLAERIALQISGAVAGALLFQEGKRVEEELRAANEKLQQEMAARQSLARELQARLEELERLKRSDGK